MLEFQLMQSQGKPIAEQLAIEEQLLRFDSHNWCLINDGAPPAIVMGVSGKKEELVDCARLAGLSAAQQIPLLKRFSGGGTVVVDEDTLFVTFICNKRSHSFPAFPEPIMRWAGEFFVEAFQIEGFALRENDFVIGERKCGGNAQYIRKDRWLHHTSFLWDYSEEKMGHLLLPKKRPTYRGERSHGDFLCRLKDYAPSRQALVQGILTTLKRR